MIKELWERRINRSILLKNGRKGWVSKLGVRSLEPLGSLEGPLSEDVCHKACPLFCFLLSQPSLLLDKHVWKGKGGWEGRKEGREKGIEGRGRKGRKKNPCSEAEILNWVLGTNAIFGDRTIYKTLGTDSAMTHSPFWESSGRFFGKTLSFCFHSSDIKLPPQVFYILENKNMTLLVNHQNIYYLMSLM